MKDKIRVLRIIGECRSGGTETIALNYYNEIDHNKIGMDFLFYGDSLPRFDAALEKNGDRVVNVPLYTKDLVGSIRGIKKAVKEGHYDVVHSQLNVLNLFPLLGAKLGGAKVRVASNHSTANLKHEFKKSIMKYMLRPTAGLLATHYAACSKYAGAWCFGRKKLAQGKIKIIHNAIDLKLFSFTEETREFVRAKEGWNGRFVIGHAGRFTTQKNHKFIIEIFKELHAMIPGALLVLVGEGDLMPEIKNQVKELGLEKYVCFMGIRFDLDKLMQGMDVFLFPSLYEGLGNVVTEAQSVSLHVVASDVVPREVKMTEYVDFISLKESALEWANVIKKYAKGYERIDTHPSLIKHGYEIKSAAKDLEKYYISIANQE